MSDFLELLESINANSNPETKSENQVSAKVSGIKGVDITSPWWEVVNPPCFGNINHNRTWVELGLDVLALAGAPAKLSHFGCGRPNSGVDVFLSKIDELGGRVVRKSNSKTDGSEILIVWPHGAMFIDYDDEGHFGIQTRTNDKAFFDKVSSLTKDELVDTPPKGKVYVAVQSEFGLIFESLYGIAGQKIERGNYTNEVLEGYDRILEDFRNKNPLGRLVVLNGPPGSGKTTMVKAAIADADNCLFIVVPPDMLRELGSPAVLPSLIELRRSKGENVPLVFIVEDADRVLTTREDGDMSSISAVLNLCDGILGSLLDIRVIATTNQERINIDSALMRKGRLSANLEILPLKYDQALEVLRRLSGPDAVLPKKDSYSLAELYGISKDGSALATGTVEKKKPKAMGFGS